jgi:site-specific recombinase XerD
VVQNYGQGSAESEVIPGSESDLHLAALLDRMRGYAEASRAPNTWRAYQSDLRHFTAWCADRELEVFPAAGATVAAYLTDYAGVLSVATLERRLYALSALHRAEGLDSPADSPEVKAVWSGIKRTHRTQRRQKTPTGTKLIAAMVAEFGERRIDTRDRALLLMGFAGAFRRSELVSLDVEDITETEDGLRIAVRRSKSDQEGEGAAVGLPYGSNPETCPVRAWRAWLGVSGIREGPAFRAIDRHDRMRDGRLSPAAVAEVVKRRAAAAGQDAAVFAAHSLRAGFATEAFGQGVPEFSVMRHGRWKSATSMRTYIREGSLFRDNAAAKLGL